MVLTFESRNYVLTYKGHVENKTGIKYIQVFGDIHATKYIGKTTDVFEKLKFQLPVNLPF